MAKEDKAIKFPKETSVIRADLDSLKTDAVQLTKHIGEQGAVQAKEYTNVLLERLGRLREAGRAEYENIERRVKEKPGQSLAIAFVSGLIASMLLNRR